MRLLFVIVKLLLIQVLLTLTLISREISTPLNRASIPMLEDIGIFAGIGGNIQSGFFYSSCPCDFIDGRGTSYFAGIMYEAELFTDFRYGIDVMYKAGSLSSYYIEIEPFTAKSKVTGREEIVSISSRNTADFDISYVSFQPFIKFYPFNYMYLKVSVAGSIPISSNVTHTQELMQKTVLLSTGEIGNVYMTDASGNIIESGKVKLSESEYPEVNSFQLWIVPTIGFDIIINKKMRLSPSFQFYLPLSTVSDFSDPPPYVLNPSESNFKISSWNFRLEFRHTLLSDEQLKIIPDE